MSVVAAACIATARMWETFPWTSLIDFRGKSEFVWIGSFEPSERELSNKKANFSLHPLAIEDALKANQMPKVDIYGAQLFVMTRTAHLEHDHIAYVETAIFVGTNFIISARHGRIATFARNSSGTGPYKIAFGDWETVALPPYSKDSAMRKRYPAHEKSLEERLAEHATRLREEAKALPPGTAREAVLRRVEQAETVADMTELCRPRLKSNA